MKRRESVRGLYSTFCGTRGTIYALSSGYGKCGVAVIRVSGSKTREVLVKMTGNRNVPTPRKSVLRTIVDPKTGDHLDKAMILWFPGPRSYTGEDLCEFHVHGGRAVISSVFRALSSLPGLRHAEPGDYTKRAFLNGKLDLTEVEGLGDLIHAETEEQRKQAFKQMEGRLKNVIEDWSRELLHCLAHIEAYIDFGEDQHIEDNVLDEVSLRVDRLTEKIELHINDKRHGERLRSGVKLAIIGKPNVGKSSLLNLITSRPAAIVSPVAGTTRDIVETTLDIDGFPVILSDTAGLRDTDDSIEIEGVRRAKAKASEADLILHVIEASKACRMTLQDIEDFSGASICEKLDMNQKKIVVLNKSDILTDQETADLKLRAEQFPFSASILSCQTQHGLEDFLSVLSKELKVLCCGEQSSMYSPSLTQERHRVHVSNCLDDLRNCAEVIQTDVVIAAEFLRLGMNELGKLTGKISPEDVLDIIFKDFCIGK